MAELCVDNCDCTNVTIMQLFHELKQKFPAVPDRVISECIRKNHDKGKCEWVLEKENRAYLLYSYPPGLGHTKTTMAASTEDFPAEGAPVAPFERSVPGRQSLDSLCRRRRLLDHHHYRHLPHLFHDKNTERFKHHFSDEFLNRRKASAGMEGAGACDERCSVCFTPRLLDRNERSDPFPLSANTCCCDQLNLTTVIDCKRRSGGDDDDDDVRFEFVSGDKVCCRCERTRVSVSSSASAPVTPSGCQLPFAPLSVDVTTPRHRTALSVEPAPPYLAQVESPSQSQRPFTTVSLTLRPPSCDPQPPIDIRSSAGGGLTYSSCSYHPHQGFRSRLQISIGPGGQGNVSAARTKTALLPLPLRAASSMPDVATVDAPTSSFGRLMLNSPVPPPVEPLNPATQAIVNKQLEKKERLQRELENEKERLKAMREKVTSMELDLRNRLEGNTATSRRTKVQELRDEILRLRTECKHMTAEVDLSSENQVPLGETREDFYRDIYREQEEAATLVNPSSGTELRSTLNSVIERRLLPETSETTSSSSSSPVGAAGGGGAVATGDGPNWMCYMCTFRNHPLLNKCEQCDGPRIVLGTAMSSESRTQTQNIHIHVTHHNFPSSSPSSSSSSSSRRMAHSWVV